VPRREQAATCLKALGIPIVLAGSVGVTYQRNAFNNGFMAISSPLVRIGRVLAAYWPRIGRALRQTNCAGSDGQHCGLQPALGRPSCRPAHIDVPRGANRIGRLYHTPHNAALLWRPPQLLDFLRERLGLVGARAGAPAVAELTLRTRLNATIDFAKWCFHPPLPCCSPFRHPTPGTHTHTHTHTHTQCGLCNPTYQPNPPRPFRRRRLPFSLLAGSACFLLSSAPMHSMSVSGEWQFFHGTAGSASWMAGRSRYSPSAPLRRS
jgi:hypothetical protein